ncbi:uncharacterized protein [Medicago truncatula]|uniref:uncharacterized protein n=1 Tax=Medicago truncatula TaxID=3880 RepID=UPI00196832E1|nr:uncharacterized protein LOC120578303 [Medicago truncatula]
MLESIIKKSSLERGSKVEDIAERLESIIGKSNHEWGNKVESIVERLESIIEKGNHEWGSTVESIAEILESIIEMSDHERGSKDVDSIIEKSDHEWGIKEEDISETKKMNLEKEEIITSSQNKNDPNQKWIPALKNPSLNFLSNLGFITSKISEAFLGFLTFIKNSYNCLKPYIIGLMKITSQLLIGFGKVIVSLAIIVIKISMQLLIGIGKILSHSMKKAIIMKQKPRLLDGSAPMLNEFGPSYEALMRLLRLDSM